MEGVLAGLAFATPVNDAMEVWDKIEKSFARVSQNRRNAQRLVRDIGYDLNTLKQLYNARHQILDKASETETAVRTLIGNMEHALEMCSQLLPPVSVKRFKKYTLKYYAWKNGSKIEEELLDMKSHVSNCYQRFTLLAAARTEIRVIELQENTIANKTAIQEVTISRTAVIRNVLADADLTVSDNHLCSFHSCSSVIPPSIVIDIPNEYLKILLSAISNNLVNHFSVWEWLAVGNSSIYNHAVPIDLDGNLLTQDRDSLHRDAVALSLDIQRKIETFSIPRSKTGFLVRRLTKMVHRLGMSRDAENIDLRRICTRGIHDKCRPEIRSRYSDATGDRLMQSKYEEEQRYLSILDQKVDLFFQFCERHREALDASEEMTRAVYWAYVVIHLKYEYFAISRNIDDLTSAIEDLRSHTKKIHEIDKSLPPLDI